MGSIYTDGTYLARNPAWRAADSAWKADRVCLLGGYSLPVLAE